MGAEVFGAPEDAPFLGEPPQLNLKSLAMQGSKTVAARRHKKNNF